MSNKIQITRDIDGIERVEKLAEIIPGNNRYEWRDFYEMLNEYANYCYNAGTYYGAYKTFKEWLDTEI